MFLVDKYYTELDNIQCYQSIIHNIMKSIDNNNLFYNNINTIINKPNHELKIYLDNLFNKRIRLCRWGKR